MYEVKATKFEKPLENVVGLASMVVDDKFTFNDIKIIKSNDVEKGLFVSMPGYKSKSGEHIDFFHPTTKEMYSAVNEAVLRAYEMGQNINIGNKETKINSYVVDAHDFGKVRANVTVSFDEDFECSTISLREDPRFGEEENLYVARPHYYTKSGMYKPYVDMSRDFFKEFESDIMKKYQAAVEKTAERQKAGIIEENMTVTVGGEKTAYKPTSR